MNKTCTNMIKPLSRPGLLMLLVAFKGHCDWV